jgi:thioredoxin 1
MRPFQMVAFVIVVTPLAFMVGLRAGRSKAAAPDPSTATPCTTCCGVARAPGASTAKCPAIPVGSGLPCLAEFGSDKCADCKKMAQVMDEAEARLKGKVDIARVDSDVHLGEVQRRQLRVVPTQILVDPTGKELWRHEGYIATEELLAKVHDAVPGAK